MPRQSQVRTPICRILGSWRVVLDAAAGDKRSYEFRDAQDRNLVVVANVQRTAMRDAVAPEVTFQPLDDIVDITPTARLGAVAINRQNPGCQCLDGKIRDGASIVDAGSWPICVEDPDDANVEPADPLLLEQQCLCAALAFIIGSPGTGAVHRSPVTLGLR